MSKHSLLVTSVICVLAAASAPAAAADMPVKAPPLPVAIDGWGGFYLGANAGVGQDSSKTSETWNWLTNYPTGSLIGNGGGPLFVSTGPLSFNTVFSDQYHHSSIGLLGGVQAGYNWQFGKVVFGVEADWSGSTQRDTVAYTAQPVASIFPPVPNFFFIPGTFQGWTSEEKLDWLATWRARIGLAQGNSLWYVTGGAAAGRIETKYLLLSTPGNSGLPVAGGGAFGLPGGVAGGSFATTKLGWTAGAGVETKIGDWLGWGPGWSAKLEYLYVDLGDVNNVIGTGLVPVCGTTCAAPVTGSTTFTSALNIHEQLVRVGLNYRFNAGSVESSVQPAIYKAPPAPVAIANWTGLYAGVNVGVGEDSSKASETWNWLTNYPTGSIIGNGGGPLFASTTPLSFNTVFSNQYHHSSMGLLGGVQAGYNWQSGKVVFGVEADWSGSTQRDTVAYAAQPVAGIFPPIPNFFFVPGTFQGWTSEEKIDWLATWRARIGLAHGNSLWYVTGGAAAGRIETKYLLQSSPGNFGLAVAAGPIGAGTFAAFGLPGGVAGGSFATTKLGWTAGAGVETKIGDWLGWGPGWSAKLEYLYVDLGDVNNVIGTGLAPVCGTTCAAPVTGSTTFTSSLNIHEQIVRVGLNHKFSIVW